MNVPLDMEMTWDKEDCQFQVWTAGVGMGAIIGLGATETAALGDAVLNMEAACKWILDGKEIPRE